MALPRLDAEQRKTLDAIHRGAKRKKASPKQIKAAIETGLVEADLRNPKHGDRDSEGWRQERKSLYPDPTNLDRSVDRFFDETAKVKHKYGRAGDLAAAVQRPAAQYRGRYQERSADADKLMGRVKPTGKLRPSSKSTTTRTKQDVEGALLDSLMSRKGGKGSLLKATATRLDTGAYDTQVKETKTVEAPEIAREQDHDDTPAPEAKGGKVTFAPGADRPGVATKDIVKDFLADVARLAGTVNVGTGTQHSRMTSSGNVSDHWTGNGADIPARGAKGDRIAYAAFRAAGVDEKKARLWASNGGLYNINHRGRRIQIIWKTNVGGNHHDHVHVGIK